MADQTFNHEMGNMNGQNPAFDASSFHRAVLPFKGVLLFMADQRAAQNQVPILRNRDLITRAFTVVEIVNLSLLFVATSRSKAVFRVIYFVLHALSFELLLWMAVYWETFVTVNLCLLTYAVVELHQSESFWRHLREVFQPLDDQPFSDVELGAF